MNLPFSPNGVPMLMTPVNFNRCAIEQERLVDSLDGQIDGVAPGSAEARALLSSRKKLVEVRDAFRILALLEHE